MSNSGYNFDIDTHSNEEALLDKITSKTADWEQLFIFGRGVEISKAGKVVYCPHCNYAQGYKKNSLRLVKRLVLIVEEKFPLQHKLFGMLLPKNREQRPDLCG